MFCGEGGVCRKVTVEEEDEERRRRRRGGGGGGGGGGGEEEERREEEEEEHHHSTSCRVDNEQMHFYYTSMFRITVSFIWSVNMSDVSAALTAALLWLQ
ncbi:hypothetical protein CesoFtcFv8_011447 [Champsocephalus esox]|uniref:Uncharacterized protein n=1 Tax=Champsocephalus esox TaxID=159716 RepID=A0AAN8C486_9TELE|nr:hypothetical protein CesoFtcFv8_011447 [Champsocephalus esox]